MMTNIEIDGNAEYVPIDSIEIDGNAEDLSERLKRSVDELNVKQTARNKIVSERELTAHINKYYGRELKDVGAFITLCKVKKYGADDDQAIKKLFMSLPKSSKKNALSRFLKL